MDHMLVYPLMFELLEHPSIQETFDVLNDQALSCMCTPLDWRDVVTREEEEGQCIVIGVHIGRHALS